MTNKTEKTKPLIGNDTNLISGSANTGQALSSKENTKPTDECACECLKAQNYKKLYNTCKLIGLQAKFIEDVLGDQAKYKWGDKFNVSALTKDLLEILNRDGNQVSGLSSRNIRKLIKEGIELLDIF